jgi:hypothetical protein
MLACKSLMQAVIAVKPIGITALQAQNADIQTGMSALQVGNSPQPIEFSVVMGC